MLNSRDGQAELRLVDLDERSARGVEQRERISERVAPGRVTKFDGDGIAGKRVKQPREIVARRPVALEARWELRQQSAHLAARRKRIDTAPELVEIRLVRLREDVEQRFRLGVSRRGAFHVRAV